MLNPTFTWGYDQSQQKGSESRRRDPTTPTPRHITSNSPPLRVDTKNTGKSL